MAAQKGVDFLLKHSADGTTYTTIAGLRDTSISQNEETIDVTNKDSSQVRTLLAGGGVYSLSASGSGVLTDEAIHATLEGVMNSSSYEYFQIVVPGLGDYKGQFALTSLEYSGSYNGEATYSLSLESAGAITFTAE